ncbi:P1 family peptidase [Gordonia sp. CPCC 205515]|uniref:P1 family peptidase n=1 Tax=Gordonia sp. CPCC 205515 TaxID=3140791 RepID=UPI003AF3554B
MGESARAGDRITEVAGIEVGQHHFIDADAKVATVDVDGAGWATGTTIVRITAPNAVCAVDVRGGGPGTRETDLLDPSNTVQTAHAIVLTGGSAYGLAAADGVMGGLEAAGVGLPMDERGHVVPIVPAAVIFDLPVGDWTSRPDADFGRRALAGSSGEVAIGSVGAGAGARAGAVKGGVGTASRTIADGPAAGITVGALMVANPVGSVIDPATGLPWGAGASELGYHGLQQPSPGDVAGFADLVAKQTVLNTTIGVVATDATLDPASTKRVAMAAHDGLARAIVPAHSPLDGDTIFAVATGRLHPEPPPLVPRGMNPDVAVVAEVGRVAAVVVARAIVGAVLAATSVAGIPAYRDVVPSAFTSRAE